MRRVGTSIRSCHAKDVRLDEELTVHLEEVRPGAGGLDLHALVNALEAIGPELPLIIEHLSSKDEYVLAAEHIRSVCREASVSLIAPQADAQWGTR